LVVSTSITSVSTAQAYEAGGFDPIYATVY
jgi:hypothetical protein